MLKRPYIIIVIFIVSFLALFIYLRSIPKINNYPPDNKIIVAFGDSLVKGIGAAQGEDFISILSAKLNRPIVNLGVSGETTAKGLSRIDEVISMNPGTVFVLFGGNDYLQRIPKTETFSNLQKIVSRLQSEGILVILLGVRGGLLNDGYEDDFESLATQTGSIYVPNVLYGLLGDNRYMSADGIHPNSTGYAKIGDKVYDIVKRYFP